MNGVVSGKTLKLPVKQDILWRCFSAWLFIQKKRVFSSDDLRLCFKDRLDEFMGDLQHDIGAIFAYKVATGEIKEVGRVPSRIESNKRRKIGLYTFTKPLPKIVEESSLDKSVKTVASRLCDFFKKRKEK